MGGTTIRASVFWHLPRPTWRRELCRAEGATDGAPLAKADDVRFHRAAGVLTALTVASVAACGSTSTAPADSAGTKSASDAGVNLVASDGSVPSAASGSDAAPRSGDDGGDGSTVEADAGTVDASDAADASRATICTLPPPDAGTPCTDPSLPPAASCTLAAWPSFSAITATDDTAEAKVTDLSVADNVSGVLLSKDGKYVFGSVGSSGNQGYVTVLDRAGATLTHDHAYALRRTRSRSGSPSPTMQPRSRSP